MHRLLVNVHLVSSRLQPGAPSPGLKLAGAAMEPLGNFPWNGWFIPTTFIEGWWFEPSTSWQSSNLCGSLALPSIFACSVNVSRRKQSLSPYFPVDVGTRRYGSRCLFPTGHQLRPLELQGLKVAAPERPAATSSEISQDGWRTGRRSSTIFPSKSGRSLRPMSLGKLQKLFEMDA